MIIDTSVLLAILFSEPDADTLVDAIADARTRAIAAPTLVEATAVTLARVGAAGAVALDALIARLEIAVVPMSVEAGVAAQSAYARYGKGVGSPGVLTFGDCLSYGVSVTLNEPLLYQGEDFAQTDVESALP